MQIQDLNSLAQTANPVVSSILLVFLLFDKYSRRSKPDSALSVLQARVDGLEKASKLATDTTDTLFKKIDSLTSQIANMRVDVATLVERTAKKG